MMSIIVVCLVLLVCTFIFSIILGKPTRKIAIKSQVNSLFFYFMLVIVILVIPVISFCLVFSDYLVSSHLYITSITVIICLDVLATSFKIFFLEFIILLLYLLFKKTKEFSKSIDTFWDYRIWKYTNEEKKLLMDDDLEFINNVIEKSPKLFLPFLNKKKKRMEDRIYWFLMSE